MSEGELDDRRDPPASLADRHEELVELGEWFPDGHDGPPLSLPLCGCEREVDIPLIGLPSEEQEQPSVEPKTCPAPATLEGMLLAERQ